MAQKPAACAALLVPVRAGRAVRFPRGSAGLWLTDHTNPPTQPEVQALRDKAEELADDLRNLSTLIHSLRTALVGQGLVKGGA